MLRTGRLKIILIVCLGLVFGMLPATQVGAEEGPCIIIRKFVKVGSEPFVNANVCEEAPEQSVGDPEDALYKIRVINCGSKTLFPVIINDPALDIEDMIFPKVPLEPGDNPFFTARGTKFPCADDDDDADTSINKITAVGFVVDDDDDDASSTVMDTDTACVLCDDDH